MTDTVRHNPELNRYELTVEGKTAVADYRLQGDRVAMAHVGVPKELENRGIGSALVKFALEDIRARGLKVVPVCPFVAAYIKRHPEWADLVA